MRLLTISLFGFKSFVDRTELKILPGITAVVGPNGCGKSNIADALRWALGEQSPKALRGQRMEDVIFHGSASRRPLGLAEALLTFSNEGEVAVPWSEVSVGRRLYRDGESEYLLNKTVCRLKDVHDLFLGTGVNPKAYALMEQERLAHILTAKPLDRRVFVEEAAGITRYKQQRAETLGKLDATRQNLLRVRDVMDEVRRQVASLERQAKKAQQYKALQAERRTLALALVAAEHAGLTTEERTLAAQQRQEESRLEALRVEVARAGALLEATRADFMAAEHRAADLRHTLQRAELELEGSLTRAQQLRAVERDLAAEAARLGEEAQALGARLEALAEERVAKRELAESLGREFADLRARAAREEKALEGLRQGLRAARDGAEGLRGEQVRLASRRTEVGQALGTLAERREQVGRRLERLAAEEVDLVAEGRRLEGERAAVQGRLAEATVRVAGSEAELRRLGGEVESAARERAAALGAAEACRVSLAGRRSRLTALEALEAERAGYGSGVRAVFQASRDAGLHGVVGTVADLLEVPRDLERAVEAALGDRLQWVVMDTFASAKDALGYLGDRGGGQAMFLPLDWLNGGPSAHVPSEDGVVGMASGLVHSEQRGLVRNLLGAVVVVRDLAAAERLWSQNGADTSFVTMAGEVLAPPGALGGGRASGTGDGSLLARKRAIRDLSAEIAELERSLDLAVDRGAEAEARVLSLGAEQRAAGTGREAAEAARLVATKDLEQAGRESERVAVAAEACRSEIGQLRDEVESAEAEIAVRGADLAQVEAEAERTGAEIARLLAGIEADAAAEAERGQAFLDLQVELAALAGRIEAARSDAERISGDEAEARERIRSGEERRVAVRARVDENAGERTRLEARAEAARAERARAAEASREATDEVQGLGERVRGLGDELRGAESELARTSRDLQGLTVRLTEVRVRRQDLEAEARRQYEVTPEGLDAALDPDRDLAETRARIEAVTARIAALEPVNLIADEEYRELDERLAFLRAQHDDLTASMKDLEKALRGMTRTAQDRFEEAFEAINRNFQMLFARLFEGGRAELRLVEAPEGGDPLETGIEMVAQPRGKRLQAISLLSGGEKALTGLALLFAIFYYRPSPFCLLDEVDAPLDDANIHRFTRVLRELAGQTQFIVITHNRKTMEAADVLYGVTMEEPGLSRLVSVSLA
ncbi:MAG: chromosome segregation protein SMC [Candidatus Rokuibacteriota bacterium]|nr:MAG: chromosome segregation protein SMC [Candidatus Rokubacteria bacterium]